MIATRNEITRFIPQRPPLVMIHDLVNITATHATTQFEILPDNVFAEDGFFKEPGLVENIAQTAAAHVGYLFDQKGLPIPIGYIASIKDLTVIMTPPVGAVIQTSVQILNQVLEVTVVEGITSWNEQVICKCEMRIFVKKQ